MKIYTDIGARLREERERLGLSQPAMGEIGGVKKLTQLNYEKGDRTPDASYLSNLAKFGLDVQYVVTGVRAMPLIRDELELLESYRAAPIAVKAAAIAALNAGTKTNTESGANQSGTITGVQRAGGSITNMIGDFRGKKDK